MCVLLWLVSLVALVAAVIFTLRIVKQVGYIRTNWPGHLNSFIGQFPDIHKHLGLGLPVEPPRRLLVHRIRLAAWGWALVIALGALLALAC